MKIGIVQTVFLLGLVSLVAIEASDCMDSYTDLTSFPGFTECGYSLEDAVEENKCGFYSADGGNYTLDLTNKLLTSYKELTDIFECVGASYDLKVDLSSNFIDCVAIPEDDNYTVICDPSLERTCSSLLEDDCRELYTICVFKLRQCSRKNGVQKSPQIVFTINKTYKYDELSSIEESLRNEVTGLLNTLGISTKNVLIKTKWTNLGYNLRSITTNGDDDDPDARYQIEVTIVFVIDDANEQQEAQGNAENVIIAVLSGNYSKTFPILGLATATYVKEEKVPDEFVNNGKTYVGSGAVIGCVIAALVLVIIAIGEIVYLANYHDTKFKGKPVPSSFLNVIYVDDDLSSDEESSESESESTDGSGKRKKRKGGKEDAESGEDSSDANGYSSDTYSKSVSEESSESGSEDETESESETEDEDESEEGTSESGSVDESEETSESSEEEEEETSESEEESSEEETSSEESSD